MDTPKCINDNNESAFCTDSVTLIVGDLLVQPEDTTQQGYPFVSGEGILETLGTNLNESACEELVDPSALKEKGHKDSPIILKSDETHNVAPPDSIEEPHSAGSIFSPDPIDDTSEQGGRKLILKDIILEYSVPHGLSDELTLIVMPDDGYHQIRLTGISTTKWKAVENIECDPDSRNLMLVAHSKELGDEGFHILTADELYAMTYAEEDTSVNLLLVSVKEDSCTYIQMNFTIVSCLDTLHIIQEFQRRFKETGDVEHINQIISHCEREISLSSSLPIPGGMHVILSILGDSFSYRFTITGNLKDIDYAIIHYQKSVNFTPLGHIDFPGRLNNVGIAYLHRFEHTGNIDDINHAIIRFQKVVDSIPSGYDRFPYLLVNLGHAYLSRFNQTGKLEDIDYAILHNKKLVDCTSSGHAEHPRLLNILGVSYLKRFERTGNIDDIAYAISHQQNAVISAPSGHINLPSWLYDLGLSYLRRFEQTGNLEDINFAIYNYQKSVNCTPSGHPDLSGQLNDLGILYGRRFERTGNLKDIDHAIFHLQKAVDSTPYGHPDLRIRLNNLGNSYSIHFEHSGNIEDINVAISHHQKAVNSTPSGHADLPVELHNLGNSYVVRFDHNRALNDINYAIYYHQMAVDSTPSIDTGLPERLSSLGSSYRRRFERNGNLDDIDYAISHQQKAVDYTPSGHKGLPGFRNTLGCSYMRRFERNGNLDDINCAISQHQKAVDSSPSDHADLPRRLSNLGNSYLRRFEHTGNHGDIDSSVSYNQKAVNSTPSSHTTLRARLFLNIGSLYARRFESSSNELDVQNSIASYRLSAQSNGSPSIRLTAAKLAAKYSVNHEQSQCLLDFGLVIGLISEVAGLEHTIHRRYDNLHGYSYSVGAAVAVAFIHNRPDVALEWLEQGRCLVWNQIHQLHTPIEDLRTINPYLADQFVSAATALELYGSRPDVPIIASYATLVDEIHLQNNVQKHTIRAIQYNKLLDKIRALPDFQDFLRPPKMTDILSSLPENGPVILFNIHMSRCDALALMSGIDEPLHIPLKNFSLDMAKELLKTLRFDLLKNRETDDQDRTMPQRVKSKPASMSYVLKELWYNVVKPVLEALGYPCDISDRRRIWWCPTGPIAFLPLHAAGIYGSEYTPGSCISDYAVSSYTPTVQSLKVKFSASSAAQKRTKILLINPNSPGLGPIPFTRAETHSLKELFGESALLLEDAAATTDTVKTELSTHNWVHFACHGTQDLVDPLKSGVHLFNGRLELLDIMRQKLSNPELAFLSACQTSKGDLNLSDEVVHLAAGMLAAGYRGVVATMWSISDLHGPQFAKHFYDYLIKDKTPEGLDSNKAAYALDYATRKVRETLGEGDDIFLTWVPYVHFGY